MAFLKENPAMAEAIERRGREIAAMLRIEEQLRNRRAQLAALLAAEDKKLLLVLEK